MDLWEVSEGLKYVLMTQEVLEDLWDISGEYIKLELSFRTQI